MKNKIVSIILVFIAGLFLTGCSKGPGYYLKKLESKTGIQYMSNAKIEFFYKNIAGYDSCGVFYYVLIFENEPTDFLNQFKNDKIEDYEKFYSGKNVDFEDKVNAVVSTHMEKEYSEFDDSYKIDWNTPYMYKNNTPSYVTLPMIYYEDSLRLIIIELIM